MKVDSVGQAIDQLMVHPDFMELYARCAIQTYDIREQAGGGVDGWAISLTVEGEQRTFFVGRDGAVMWVDTARVGDDLGLSFRRSQKHAFFC